MPAVHEVRPGDRIREFPTWMNIRFGRLAVGSVFFLAAVLFDRASPSPLGTAVPVSVAALCVIVTSVASRVGLIRASVGRTDPVLQSTGAAIGAAIAVALADLPGSAATLGYVVFVVVTSALAGFVWGLAVGRLGNARVEV